jgi:hypothetical protein
MARYAIYSLRVKQKDLISMGYSLQATAMPSKEHVKEKMGSKKHPFFVACSLEQTSFQPQTRDNRPQRRGQWSPFVGYERLVGVDQGQDPDAALWTLSIECAAISQ